MTLILSGTDGLSDVDGTAATPAIRGTDTNTGIFFPAADTIAFSEGGAESMRLDSAGNVAIGTTIAGAKFHVYGTGSTYAKIQSVNAFTGAGLYFENNTRNWLIGAGPNSGGSEFQFYDVTASAERARITSGGQFMVGTTSDLGRISVAFPGATTFGAGINNTDTGTNGQTSINFLRNGTSVGTINTTNTATSFNTSSDYRLKHDIAPMTGALAKVVLLKPCTYKWNADNSDGEGFIAHELAEVVPQCVTGEKDAVDAEGKPVYQGIDTSFLVATLTAAIQEQQALIVEMKTEINALKAKVNA